MLKQQHEELALHQENPTDHSEASILENHQGFMLAVTVLQDSMFEVFGDKAKREKKHAVDPFTPVYHCNNGNTTYCCPQCNYSRLSKGAIYTHLSDTHGMPKFNCSQCDFKSANKIMNYIIRDPKGNKYMCYVNFHHFAHRNFIVLYYIYCYKCQGYL